MMYTFPSLENIVTNAANNWHVYLLPDPDHIGKVLIDNEEFDITAQDAVIDGYLYGLHLLRAYEPVMLEHNQRRLIERINEDFYDLEPVNPTLAIRARDYLALLIPVRSAEEMADAFISGYILAHHQARRYNTCIFITEFHKRRDQVVADLKTWEDKLSNKLRAQARIADALHRKAGLKAAIFPNYLLDDNGNPVDNDGNPVDESTSTP